MLELDISSMSRTRFRSVLSPEPFEAFNRGILRASEVLAGRALWSVNSTACGSDVVQVLESLVPYARGAGVDVRWAAIEAASDFFAVTKRIRNRPHGTVGDGGVLHDEARAVYDEALADNRPALADRALLTVIAQKSLAGGFGLTVVEAMWTARPVIASPIGGKQSQIVRGASGVRLDDPRDLQAFGEAVTVLLEDPQHAEQLGKNSRARVRNQFTSPRSVSDHLGLILRVLGRSRVRVAA